MKKIKIGKKSIGEGEPCFIIAEAGVNHNGDIKLAKKLVEVAKEAGADAVKFQTFKAEKTLTKNVEMAEYQKKNTGKEESQFDMAKRLELSEDDFFELKKHCDKRGIIFLSTPHSNEWSVDVLENIGVDAYKIGSGDLTNKPFLEYVAKTKKPILLSTGMSYMKEVKKALLWITKHGNGKIIVLHCTTNYPTPYCEVNINAMLTMMKEIDFLVGYSDHTEGIEIPILARAMGACLIEKHFTIDKNMEGPDHKASIEPNEMKFMIKAIRNIEMAFGCSEKKPNKSEEKIMPIIRKSLVSSTDIKKGDVITKKMIDIKRPGTGIQPEYYDKIIGKKSKTDIKKDTIIKWENIV